MSTKQPLPALLLILLATGLLLFGSLLCCDDGDDEVTPTPCPGGCPDGQVCAPDGGHCIVLCLHPSFPCAGGRECDPASGECVEPRADTGVDGCDGATCAGEGEGEGEGGGEGEGEGEGEGSAPCPDGICGPDETKRTCPADCRLETICGDRPCPPVPCGDALCAPRHTCVAGQCVLWSCGEACQGSARCTREDGLWECVPLACVEDRFSGTNSSPLQAASLVPGTYGLAFCVTRDDWFAIDIPAGRSLVAEAAFTLPDPDLDLELYRVLPNDELRRVTADVGVASNAALVHAAPAGEGGRHLLHVFQQLPAGVEPIPMYYALRLTITAAPACRRDADCDAESLCDLVQHLCEPRFCGRNFECGPLEECDPESGRCTSRGCPPDALAGVNGSIDTAASVVIGQEVAGTICDRESDWYRVDVPAGQCVHAAVRFRVPPEAPDSDIDVALHGPRDGDPRALLLEAANPARDDEDVYWSTTEAVTLYLNVFKALQNAYRLTVTLTEGACSLPCSAEDDPCIRYGLRCDEELRRCVPFGG